MYFGPRHSWTLGDSRVEGEGGFLQLYPEIFLVLVPSIRKSTRNGIDPKHDSQLGMGLIPYMILN